MGKFVMRHSQSRFVVMRISVICGSGSSWIA